jgi:enoyl-CoA hydratase/carnithine racemase
MRINVEQHDTACLITLDKPEKRNALSRDDVTQLTDIISNAGRDADIKGVVLTGNGAFCAGADLLSLPESTGRNDRERRESIEGPAQGMIRALLDVPVPTIAAVDGPAVGMGFDLALACDSLLVGPEGWCMQGWGRVGLIPGTGGELLLRARAPHLMWRLLECQPKIDADLAAEWRIGEKVPARTARAAALARIERLGGLLSRAALQGYVTLSRAELKARLDDHLVICADVQSRLLGSAKVTAQARRILHRRD